ncbi:TetR/AcrR family transcriptional regulator [Phycicoccus flavus]|uniref:TetR/AcrR family transcriptional regulator n=1 Tax=Phycicoccus flavus TaxID=2502783 RepID=A0A8T6R2C1_9MICO|nr:TetR/AcrR family transcriptional regulator [Phycicoccus flavus]NHA68127.1 TetR/AcrR family transcriptional regulator [Phycicoccus flavus]
MTESEPAPDRTAGRAESHEPVRTRRRDPERTRQALLAAALAEFAEKGLAGARVDVIAERAGVNKQLISYHFGGKQGLYDALLTRWQEQDDAITDPSVPLSEVAVAYLRAACADPERVRFSVREALDGDPARVEHDPDAPEVAHVRARQDAGEVTDLLDPAFVLMLLQGVVMSGTVFPVETVRLVGLHPGSPEHEAFVAEQLRRLVTLLGPGSRHPS